MMQWVPHTSVLRVGILVWFMPKGLKRYYGRGDLHFLISESSGGTPSLILKVLKQRVARDLRNKQRRGRAEQEHISDISGEEGLLRFWQPRFYDFNVYSADKKREKLEYMHSNPVTRGLVQHPKDWPWSSFSYYAKGEAGLVAIDPVE